MQLKHNVTGSPYPPNAIKTCELHNEADMGDLNKANWDATYIS